MSDYGLQIRMALTLVFLGGVYGLLGAAIVGDIIPFWLFLIGLGSFFIALYIFGFQMMLRQVNARQIPRDEAPNLFNLVDRAAEGLDVTPPDVVVGDFGSPNAFAIGRPDNGTVVVSESLIELLEPEELAAVLTHELSHVRNRDVLLLPVGHSFGLFAGYLQYRLTEKVDNEVINQIAAGVVMLVSLTGFIFTRPFSQYREYVADREAAQIVGESEMADALEKMADEHDYTPPATAASVRAFFTYNTPTDLPETIVSSHPPVEERIEALRSTEAE